MSSRMSSTSHPSPKDRAARHDEVCTHTSDRAPFEQVVLDIVSSYLSRKLKAKHGLEWKNIKDDPAKRNVYEDEKEKLAKGVFYAVRSRTGKDFVDYFASTLCSVPQFLDEARFGMLAAALR